MSVQCEPKPKPKPPPYDVPDYRKFSIKGIKQLEEVQQALCKVGLSDPWLRNEAWRYHPGFGTTRSRLLKLLFRGAPLGALLAVVHFAANLVLTQGQGHGHAHESKPKADK